MQYPDTISQIKERAANIRLSVNGLAQLAGVVASTAHAKAPDGRERDVRSSTLRKLAEALVQEEIRVRDHLLSLHPVKGEEKAA